MNLLFIAHQLGMRSGGTATTPAGGIIVSFYYDDVIHMFNDEFKMLVESENFKPRLREGKPGSLRRDGDYGYTVS